MPWEDGADSAAWTPATSVPRRFRLDDVADRVSDLISILSDRRPHDTHAVLDGDRLLVTAHEDLSLVETLMIDADRQSHVARTRTHFLRVIAPDLIQLIGLLTGRRVLSLAPHFHAAAGTTELVFRLDPDRLGAEADRRGLLNWGAQVRRAARAHRADHRRHHTAHGEISSAFASTRSRSQELLRARVR